MCANLGGGNCGLGMTMGGISRRLLTQDWYAGIDAGKDQIVMPTCTMLLFNEILHLEVEFHSATETAPA